MKKACDQPSDINRARILCERGDNGYHQVTIGMAGRAAGLTKSHA
jgi:hypothetical protein